MPATGIGLLDTPAGTLPFEPAAANIIPAVAMSAINDKDYWAALDADALAKLTALVPKPLPDAASYQPITPANSLRAVSATALTSGTTTAHAVIRANDSFSGSYDVYGAPSTGSDDYGSGYWAGPVFGTISGPDWGARADWAISYLQANSATFGNAILGRPMDGGLVHTWRDWIHGEIRDHHRPVAQVLTDVLHALASSQEAHDRLNDIYQAKLGHDIDGPGYQSAVNGLSLGGLTLTQEAINVSHSNEAAQRIDQQIYH